jgi:hypothetical protein
VKDFRDCFDAQEWRAGTYNRYKTTLSLFYRLGTENKKVEGNPAKLLKHKTEDKERVRFLNQFTPAKTDLEYLKGSHRRGVAFACRHSQGTQSTCQSSRSRYTPA